MKQSLEWHRKCLNNSRSHLEEHKAELARRQQEIARHQAEVDFYAKQIEEAVKRGMDSFDEDRFLKQRSKPPKPPKKPTIRRGRLPADEQEARDGGGN